MMKDDRTWVFPGIEFRDSDGDRLRVTPDAREGGPDIFFETFNPQDEGTRDHLDPVLVRLTPEAGRHLAALLTEYYATVPKDRPPTTWEES